MAKKMAVKKASRKKLSSGKKLKAQKTLMSITKHTDSASPNL